MFEPLGPEPLKPAVKIMLGIWFLLLIPWLPFAGLSGMAFDGGYTLQAYIFVWAVWTYPITLGIAFLSRRKHPGLVWLPFLNLVLAFI